MNAQDTATAALNYVARGWAVVALHDVTGGMCSCGAGARDGGDHDRSQGGKHPLRTGWQNAGMRSAAAVAEAWARRPTANIGIVTGRASGIWVLDVDPEHAGDRQLAGLVAAFGGLPETYAVRTGSGGTHYYWAMPGFDFTTSRGRLPVGLDVRGNAGQVVAPPSRTLKGSYAVLADVPVVDAPGWLLAMIQPVAKIEVERPEWTGPGELVEGAGSGGAGLSDGRGNQYALAAARAVLSELAWALPGSRNMTAYRAGRRLAELLASPWAALNPDDVYAAFMAAAAQADVDGGFSQSEAHDVLSRAVRDQGGRGVALPPAEHLGTAWAPPSAGSVGGGSDFDQAGQGPAVGSGVFTSPGQVSAGSQTSTNVAEKSINDIAEQGKQPKIETVTAVTGPVTVSILSRFEALVGQEMERQAAREEARRRLTAIGQRLTDFADEVLDDEALSKLPEPDPLIDGWLDLDCLARINGPSGQGKSFVALDIAASVATGRSWHGRRVTQAPALYVVGESPYVMNVRAAAWRQRAGVDSTGVSWLARAVTVDGPEWSAFVEYAATVAAGGLIVLDTQARMTVGSDENDATEMGLIVAGLDRLRVATRACVLLIHHRGHRGDQGRGSTAVKGAMDAEMDCSLTGQTITFKSTKQKNRADPAPMLLTMNPLGGSVVLVADGDQVENGPFTSPALAQSARQRAAVALAHALMDAAASGLTKAEARHNARVSMGLQNTDVARQTLTRGWADLIELGRIAKMPGRESFYFIEIEGLQILGMNPDKAVEGGPEVYEPGRNL